jgi:hypothetical protein
VGIGYLDGYTSGFQAWRSNHEESIEINPCQGSTGAVERSLGVDPSAPGSRVLLVGGTDDGEGDARPPSEGVRGC